jgi:hypothetical protein
VIGSALARVKRGFSTLPDVCWVSAWVCRMFADDRFSRVNSHIRTWADIAGNPRI